MHERLLTTSGCIGLLVLSDFILKFSPMQIVNRGEGREDLTGFGEAQGLGKRKKAVSGLSIFVLATTVGSGVYKKLDSVPGGVPRRLFCLVVSAWSDFLMQPADQKAGGLWV